MKTVSCNASHLYAAGGLYEDRVARDAGAAPFAALVADVYEPYEYVRELPVHVDASDAARDALLAAYARASATFPRGARSSMFTLEAAILYDRVLYAVVPPGELVSVYESDREIERPWKSSLDPSLLGNCRRPTGQDVDYVYFSSAGSENYAHWLVDDLPRIKAVRDCYAGGRRVAIVLDRYFVAIDEVRCQSIHAMLAGAVDYEIVFIEKKVPYFFERLQYVTPSTYTPHLKSPQSVAFLVDTLRVERDESAPKRLFVGRNALWRNLLDAGEAAEFFTARSFDAVSIDFGTRTLRDQIRLFSNAEVVVGVSGASMVNTVFCPPGARVFYLAGEGFVDPWYWDLACVMEQPYSVSFGVPRDPTAPNFSSFSVSRRQLETIESWL